MTETGAEPPDAAVVLALLAEYWREIVGRYQGRAATGLEVEQALRDFPSDAFAPPTGVLLVARADRRPVGCAALRWLAEPEAELARVFVAPQARRTGVARRLLAAAEAAARAQGVPAIRLEVRGDLVEAQALYDACGYARVPAFSDSPYADAWFRKEVAPGPLSGDQRGA